MINVTVNGTEQIKCNKGDNLYQVLTAAGYVFAGNCGMKGRCNRCLVWNQDKDETESRVLYEFGYNIGRWIYLCICREQAHR